jgi:hypothetical protein
MLTLHYLTYHVLVFVFSQFILIYPCYQVTSYIHVNSNGSDLGHYSLSLARIDPYYIQRI